MDAEQKKKIREVMELAVTAMKGVYMDEAIDMEQLATQELTRQLQKMKIKPDYGTVARDVLSDYADGLGKGGSWCIERKITPIGNGKVKVTAERVFVSWLDDFAKQKADDIIDLIGKAELGGSHPLDIAKELKSDFENTRHRAKTAGRTEGSKIRNDTRSSRFKEQGVQYVEWVTAGDDLVRPEHEERNGKIYRHEDSPYLGEYNCRCVLVPADYAVEIEGKSVEPDGGIIMPESAFK